MLGESSPGPTLAQLQEIREDELRHFLLLNRAMMAAEFQTALASEETHLANVRGWLEEHVLAQAQV
ncbi:MAG: hypothetical protein ABW208_24275 [Pyrinomonadaceae bacterium]